jgi:hypothetical protein
MSACVRLRAPRTLALLVISWFDKLSVGLINYQTN